MRRLVLLTPLLLLGALTGVTPAQAAPPAGERLALVIGVDHFQGSTRPNMGAVGDAEEVRTLLLRSGWPSANIRMLTDSAATNAAIHDGLDWLASRSNDTSFSVVAYSGHVQQSGSTESLWPHDNDLIPDTQVASAVRNIKGYLWMHISGCEAAGFDEGISGPRRLVTAASQSYEKGYELPAALRNSVFTNLLVDKGMLRKQADGYRDGKKDGKVSIQEAFSLAADRAPEITADQAQGPQHPYMAGGDGSEWFLEASAAPAATKPPAPKRNCVLFFCR